MGRATSLNNDLEKNPAGGAVVRSRAAVWLGWLAVIPALAATGCSGRTSYITGGPSTGQLKTSLSRLEFENDQLKTQVARLKDENRTMEDRLVQEQMHTGTLTAKLNDVQNVLRDEGLDVDEVPARPRTLPAGRRNTKPRKPPAAQISNKEFFDDEDPPPLTIEDEPQIRSNRRKPRPRRPADDSVSLNLDDDDVNWLPVATGNASKPAKR